MKIEKNKRPGTDGYYMPGEFEEHGGCIMIWPYRGGSWPFGGKRAKEIFAELAGEISQCEKVYMLTPKAYLEEAKQMLSKRVTILSVESEDAWARDTAPTFLVNKERQLRAVDWAFNAWGGHVDGLYAHWENDDALASRFCRRMQVPYYDAHPFVLEGGSVHSDGEGTLLVTESCLLSKGRNPSLSKEEIEENLKDYLGAKKVLWLPRGIYGDETNEHVDNIAAFVKPATILLAWTEDKEDPQYACSKACLEYLKEQKDARGRSLKIILLPIPAKPVCISKEELSGYCYEQGEEQRQENERLAASYINFYIANDRILLPQFGDVNDGVAAEIIKKAFPDRKVIPIMAREILLGGGNIHCITQQIPKGKISKENAKEEKGQIYEGETNACSGSADAML